MQLSHNHIFYTANANIANIVKPLEKLGINYFSFGRSYHDGSRIYLTNCCHYLDNYFKEGHYLTGNTECKPETYKDQVLFWSTAPNQKILNDCARAWGIDHGIWIFKSHENYCEIFTFATNSGNDRIINVYLSKMDLLNSFMEYFREKAASIIKQAENQKIFLPFNKTLDLNNTLIKTEDFNILPHKTNRNYSLTKRQLQCCLLLTKGKTSREIAASLDLSPRTVEYYLEIAKTKLNCKNKFELIFKLSTLGAIVN